MKRILFLLLALGALSQPVFSQYFGRNKPRYQQQDFKVTKTGHFEIYEYLNNPEAEKWLAEHAELWYRMHQAVLQDTFTELNPLLVYNDHAGFQQTNAIQGEINVGTGGVTEGLRNRVVFPFAATNQQTSHVLGHEMVHAFQYHMILYGDSTNMRNLANMPLWMIEGLAEYLSIGRIDAHTALWMRDAVLNDKLPKNLRSLDNARYFPYRWGQAFWAYVTGVYGDEVIRPLMMNTAKYGLEPAVQLTLGITSDSLAGGWKKALNTHYGVWASKGAKDETPGKRLIDKDNGGRMNLSPVLSPNGKYMVYLSEKNLFTTDLYLADAKTGKTIKKLASTVKDGHIDQFNAIESAGTWSPDSKRYAYDVYQKGRSVLVVQNVFKKGRTQKYAIPGVPSFSNPAWAPDGKTIVVSGLVNGQVDLYEFNLKSQKVQRITNDRYAEILPTWSADGQRLAFATDELSMQRGRSNGAWKMNLAVMDYASKKSAMLDVFPGADNLNPQFDKNGNIWFLSDRDGRRNLYRYDVSTQKVYQLTDLKTGITGITPYSPALTVSEDRDRLLYNYYFDNQYIIYEAQSNDFVAKEVDPAAVDMVAASLPPFDPRKKDLVNTNLRLMDHHLGDTKDEFILNEEKYKPKFRLEYMGGGAGVGVATGNTSFGNGNNVGVGGGVSMLFGDVLGDHQVFSGIGLNGQIQDINGMVSYINNKKRIGWGVNASHFPYSYFNGYSAGYTQIEQGGQTYTVIIDTVQILRLFNQRVGGMVFYPFSTTKRVELYGNVDFYQQRATNYYNLYATETDFRFGNPFDQGQEKLERGPRARIGNIGAAYVGDNSFFGMTAPLQGWRYRVGIERFAGDWNYNAVLADGRYYHRIRPITLAFRGLGYGRWGGNANNQNEVFPLYVVQPWFVRGYSQGVLDLDTTLYQSILGSKMAVANFEIRLPFTGPRRLGLIPSNFLLSDLNLFFDAGITWFTKDQLQEQPENSTIPRREPFLSTGASLRINLFGAIILEPYFALPLTVPKNDRQWVFGLNFLPGW